MACVFAVYTDAHGMVCSLSAGIITEVQCC